MNPHYNRVADQANHRCEYCRAPEWIFNFPFEIEHILPISRGGQDDDLNLALSCRSCNLHKANRINGKDPESNHAEVRLFNPRKDQWNEHFQVNLETGIITGITPIGRATVHCLEMNRQSQLTARQYWIRLNVFP
jgi:HNH endonuclease